MPEPLRAALLGTGATVARLAQALTAAGHATATAQPGDAAAVAAAVAGADVVLALNPPVASLKLARQVAPLLAPGAVYADFNPGSPAMKKRLAELFPDHGFAEGTLADGTEAASTQAPGAAAAGMGGVGLAAAVAGPGAPAVAQLLESAGVAVDTVSAMPGDAAAREILRSVLDKALAAAVIDVLWAAESMGQKDWAHRQVLATFEAASAATAQEYLGGTAQHLKRRQMEMMDVVEAMRDAGYDSTLVAAIETNYSRILHGKRVPFSKGK